MKGERNLDLVSDLLLLIGLALILAAVLAGCTYTINLTVSLPGDNAPTVSVEPQTKSDSWNL